MDFGWVQQIHVATSNQPHFLLVVCNEDDRYGKKEAGTGEHLRHFNNKINKHK